MTERVRGRVTFKGVVVSPATLSIPLPHPPSIMNTELSSLITPQWIAIALLLSVFLVMASLVIAAIPTLMVFVFCQNVILRGIVIPTFK